MDTAIIKKTGERIRVFDRRNQKTGELQFTGERYNKFSRKLEEFPITREEVLIVPCFFTRENDETLKKIREALISVGFAEVHNEYETFYGVGFDGWLRKGIADLPCEIEVTAVNHWEGYPWTYFIACDIDELAGGAPSPKHNK